VYPPIMFRLCDCLDPRALSPWFFISILIFVFKDSEDLEVTNEVRKGRSIRILQAIR